MMSGGKYLDSCWPIQPIPINTLIGMPNTI
jgi:hypothetical protein